MLRITTLLTLCLLVHTISASPFELTEKYVKEFKDGMQRLVNISRATVLKEETYQAENFDEETAAKSKFLHLICKHPV